MGRAIEHSRHPAGGAAKGLGPPVVARFEGALRSVERVPRTRREAVLILGTLRETTLLS